MKPEAVFKAMADQTRLRILQVLTTAELGVCELAEVLGVRQPTVSRHLKTLRQAGLLEARHAGTTAMYYPVRSQNGESEALNDQLIEWIKAQEMPDQLKRRLGEVLANRRTESDRFFAGMSHRWDQLRTDCFGPAFHLEALTALLPKHWTVADVGTGTGYFLPSLCKTFKRVIAIDPVQEMLKTAESRLAAGELDNVEFRSGSANKLPLETDELDLCISSLVLHHEPTPSEAMEEFHRVLKPGGIVLIIEQKTHQLADFHEQMQDRWWGFEPEELAGQLKQAGFGETEIRELDTARPTSSAAPEPPELFLLVGKAK